MASLASKRKRDPHDMPNPRVAPGMSSEEFENQYGLPNDNDSMNHHGNGMGFGVMPQHQHGGGDSGEISQGHGDAHQHHDQNQQQGQSASDTAAAAMAQYHTMTVPQSTEQAFMNHATDHSNERPTSSSMDPSVVGAHQRNNSFGDFDISGVKDAMTPSNGAGSPTQGGKNQTTPKPQVGTEEWHKVRRDNHKEVERRRRETINEGINELAKIVPGCEKNKGSILARAVQFITQLKENETQNIEKWTLEKLVTEQTIAALSSSCDKLKAECQRAWAECEQWKKAAQQAGVTVDDKGTDPEGA